MDTPHTYPYPLAYAIVMGQCGHNTTPEGCDYDYDSQAKPDNVCYRAYALFRAEYLASGGLPPGDETDEWACWMNLPDHPASTVKRIHGFLMLVANLPDPLIAWSLYQKVLPLLETVLNLRYGANSPLRVSTPARWWAEFQNDRREHN